MPALLTTDEQFDRWLDPTDAVADLVAMLRPVADDYLEAYPVTRDLAKIKEPGPEVLSP